MALPKRPTSARAKASDIQQVKQWTAEEVAEWMTEVNNGLFVEYVDNALAAKLTGSDLVILSESDMRSKLGITSTAHITTLTASIERLKKKSRRRKRSPVSPYRQKGQKDDSQNSSSSFPDIDNIPNITKFREKPEKSEPLQIHSTNTLPLAKPKSMAHSHSDVDMMENPNPKHLKKSKSVFSLTPTLKPLKSPKLNGKKVKSNHVSTGSLHSLAKTVKNKNGRGKTLAPAKRLSLGPSAHKTQRAYTVMMKKDQNDADDQKEIYDTIQLKRVLTEQNVLSAKRDKSFHKDLSKKLWPNETSIIIKEGWMKKRGLRRTGFRERWCVLRDNGHLYYFEKRPSANKGLPQGMVDLHNGVIRVEYVEDDDPNTFNIKTVDRDWIFSAMSGGQLVEWMSAINKCIELLN